MDKWTLAQLGISCALMTLIWLVQLLHYPFFRYIGQTEFTEAMHFHQKAISLITIPLMISELALAAYLAFLGRAGSFLILGIIACIWISTFALQVPLHQRLLQRKDLVLIDSLVRSNWLRTLLWTAKTFVVIYFVS